MMIKRLLLLLIMSVNIWGVTLNIEIPEAYNNKISILRPTQNMMTTEDSLDFEIQVKNDFEVYINSHKVSPNAADLFQYKLDLKRLGKQSFVIKFVNQNDSFVVIRNIIKLKNSEQTMMTHKELAVINTSFISPQLKSEALENRLKRKELAYFINQIQPKNDINKSPTISDVRTTSFYYEAIKNAVNTKTFTLNKWNQFKPENNINIVELLMVISLGLNYKVDKSAIIETEIDSNKWFFEYVQIGLQKGIIDKNDLKKLKKRINIVSFYRYVNKIPEIQKNILQEITFERDNYLSNTQMTQMRIPKSTTLNQKVSINRQYIKNNLRVIEGDVNPINSFTVNENKIQLDKKGKFSLEVPLTQSEISFKFQDKQITKNINVNEKGRERENVSEKEEEEGAEKKEKTEKKKKKDELSEYEKTYLKIFGKMPPKAKKVNLRVKLYIDMVPRGSCLVQTDSFGTYFKVDRNTIQRAIKPMITKKGLKEFSNLEEDLLSDTLVEKGFNTALKTADSKLYISTPLEWRLQKDINLGKLGILETESDDVLISHWISGYVNMDISLRTKSDNDGTDIDNAGKFSTHLNIGDIFFDAEYHYGDFENDLSFTKTARISTLARKNMFLINVGSFLGYRLVGLNIRNDEIRKLNNELHNNTSVQISLKEKARVEVESNGNFLTEVKLPIGDYKLTQFPFSDGINNIKINIISIETEKLIETIELFEYTNFRLRTIGDMEYLFGFGQYDTMDEKVLGLSQERLLEESIKIFDYKVGLFSAGQLFSNLTIDQKLLISDRQRWAETKLMAGTYFGILGIDFHVSEDLETKRLGIEYGPTIKFPRKLVSPIMRRLELSLYYHNKDYTAFQIRSDRRIYEGEEGMGIKYKAVFQEPFPLSVGGSFDKTPDDTINSRLSLVSEIKLKNKNTIGFVYSKSYRKGKIKDKYSFVATFKLEPIDGASTVVFDGVTQKYGGSASLPIAKINEQPIMYSRTIANQALSYSTKTDLMKHKFVYSANSGGDNFQWDADLDHYRARVKSRLQKGYKIGTSSGLMSSMFSYQGSLMLTPDAFAFGRTIPGGGFVIVKPYENISDGDISINKYYKLDNIGDIGIDTVRALSDNSLDFQTKNLPKGIRVRRSKIEFVPKYGKGYSYVLGEKAPVVLIGRIIDENKEPYRLIYGDLEGGNVNKQFFTNKKGIFILSVKEGHTYTLSIPGKNKRFKVKVKKNAIGTINLGMIEIY